MYMIAEVSQYVAVASFAEAWIEILMPFSTSVAFSVASFAEAWIEIFRKGSQASKQCVASFAEAWIEIKILETLPPIWRRLLRGGVD